MNVDVAEENEELQLEEPMDIEGLLGDDQMGIEEEENRRKRKLPTQEQHQKPKRKRRAPKKCRFLDMEADVEDDDEEDDMEEDELDLNDSFIAPEDELAEEMESDDYHHLNPYLHKEFVPRQKEFPTNNNDIRSNTGTSSDDGEEQQPSPMSVLKIGDEPQQQPTPAPMADENDDLESECSEVLGVRRDPTPCDEYFVDKPDIGKEGWHIMRELLHNDNKAAAIKKKRERDAERKKLERKNNREVVTYAYAHFGQKYDNVCFIFSLHFTSILGLGIWGAAPDKLQARSHQAGLKAL
jgi:hypothetical protein